MNVRNGWRTGQNWALVGKYKVAITCENHVHEVDVSSSLQEGRSISTSFYWSCYIRYAMLLICRSTSN